jgi:hypothetical protein
VRRNTIVSDLTRRRLYSRLRRSTAELRKSSFVIMPRAMTVPENVPTQDTWEEGSGAGSLPCMSDATPRRMRFRSSLSALPRLVHPSSTTHFFQAWHPSIAANTRKRYLGFKFEFRKVEPVPSACFQVSDAKPSALPPSNSRIIEVWKAHPIRPQRLIDLVVAHSREINTGIRPVTLYRVLT